MNTLVNVTDAERKLAERVNPDVASGLALRSQAGGLAFSNAGEAMEFAKLMALSQIGVRKHLRGNPGACLAIVVQAVEWRMSPYAVANKSYLVNDQIAYESQLVQAVILQRAPIKGRFKVRFDGHGDKRTCTVTATLLDGETVDYTSPEFGKITPKNSPLWKTDPDQQQFYYSGRALCRRHFPDVLLGVYAEDEIERDPEAARDVTPKPKTLQGRLDALAGGVDAPHDPDTGEIIEDEQDRGPQEVPTPPPPADAKDGGEAPVVGAPSPPSALSPDAQTLFDKLKAKAEKGSAAYRRAKGAMTPAEDALLSDEMDDELTSIAEAADKAPGDDFPGDRATVGGR